MRPTKERDMNQNNHAPYLPLAHRNEDPDATAPDGSEIRLLIDDRHSARRASLVEVTLAAGEVSKPVYHHTVEEIWYILEGNGHVWRWPPTSAPDTVPPVPVGPGDALTIPTGWRFQFSADCGGKLRFLCHTTPPWPGEDEAQPAVAEGLGEWSV